jgi:hypothetical protein
MIRLFVFTVLVAISAFGPMQAQAVIDARFSATNGSPLIGEPITLTLSATVPQGIGITGWPEFPESWAQFQVRAVDELSITENPDGSALYQQNLTVILWNVGEYETPETTIQYQLISEVETRAQTIEPVYFSVPSVLDPEDLNLRPYKPPIELPYISPVLVAGAVGGGLAILAAIIARLWKDRPTRIAQPQQAMTPARMALAELRRIAGRNLSPVLIYQSVADALRLYTQSQYNVQAMDMTTWELMNALRNRVPDATQTDLQRMLEQADLVKFARYNPNADNAQQYIEMAGRWLSAQDSKEV